MAARKSDIAFKRIGIPNGGGMTSIGVEVTKYLLRDVFLLVITLLVPSVDKFEEMYHRCQRDVIYKGTEIKKALQDSAIPSTLNIMNLNKVTQQIIQPGWKPHKLEKVNFAKPQRYVFLIFEATKQGWRFITERSTSPVKISAFVKSTKAIQRIKANLLFSPPPVYLIPHYHTNQEIKAEEVNRSSKRRKIDSPTITPTQLFCDLWSHFLQLPFSFNEGIDDTIPLDEGIGSENPLKLATENWALPEGFKF